MPGHERRNQLGERLIVRREMFEHEEEGNHTVVGIEILTKVIMPTHLTREEPVLLPHAVFHKRVSAVSIYRVERGPYHAWIEDDRVVTSILRQQNIGEERGDIRARDELTFLGEEHRAVGVSIP